MDIQKLKQWLESCGMFDVRPAIVTIMIQKWQACRYKRRLTYQRGMQAVLQGKQQEGDPYIEEFIYCVGPLPSSFFRSLKPGYKKSCYPYESHEWYVAGYIMANQITFQNKEYHPFGENFLLTPWNIVGEKIDQYENTPYVRFPLTVEYL